MQKENLVSIKPMMQADGALLIEIWTDVYPTWKDFLDARGPQMTVEMTREGIRLGYVKDLRVIEFFRTSLGGKDIDYRLMRNNGKVIKPKLPKGYKIDVEGLHLSYMGKKVFH